MKGRIRVAHLERSTVGDGWLITDELSRILETTDDAREVARLIAGSPLVSSIGDPRLSSALDAMDLSSAISCALSLPFDFEGTGSRSGSGSCEFFDLIERVTRGGPEGGERRLRFNGRVCSGLAVVSTGDLDPCSELETCLSSS